VQTHQEIIWKNKERYKLRILDCWDVTLQCCGSSAQHFEGNVLPLFSGQVVRSSPLHSWQWRQYVPSKCGNHYHMSCDV